MNWKEDRANPNKPQYWIESDALTHKLKVGGIGWQWTATVRLDGDEDLEVGLPDVDARFGGDEDAKRESVVQLIEALSQKIEDGYKSQAWNSGARDLIARLERFIDDEESA